MAGRIAIFVVMVAYSIAGASVCAGPPVDGQTNDRPARGARFYDGFSGYSRQVTTRSPESKK
jgi:hypothetical protein